MVHRNPHPGDGRCAGSHHCPHPSGLCGLNVGTGSGGDLHALCVQELDPSLRHCPRPPLRDFAGTGLVLSLQGNLDWTSTGHTRKHWLALDARLEFDVRDLLRSSLSRGSKRENHGRRRRLVCRPESQHFRFINRVTAIFNAPLVGYTLVMIFWVNV